MLMLFQYHNILRLCFVNTLHLKSQRPRFFLKYTFILTNFATLQYVCMVSKNDK